MSDSDYFAEQLRVTAEQFIRTALQIPEERRYLKSEDHWSAGRIVFHMTNYELISVTPSMRVWDGGPLVDDSALDREDFDWVNVERHRSYTDLLADFEAGRAEQIALARQLAGQWDETRETPWTLAGAPAITLRWVVTKTLQHSFEHSDELLRIWLYWDMHDAWLIKRFGPRS